MGKANKLLNKTDKLKGKISKDKTRLSPPKNVHNILLEKKHNYNRLQDKGPVSIESESNTKQFSCSCIYLERVEYDYEDYGIEIGVPSGMITASNIGSGDEVEFLEGSLEGRTLEVIEVINSTILRLDDVSSISHREDNIKTTFIMNKG